MVLPRDAKSRIVVQNSRLPSTSIAAVGSSSTSSSGLATSEREADALHLPARELLREAIRNLVGAGEREHLVDLERVGIEGRHHRHELAHAQVADQPTRLQHRADDTGGDRVRGGHAEHGRRAAVRIEQAEQDVERRRLAGAVRPEQRDRLAGSDGRVDAADGVHGAVRLRQAPELDSSVRGGDLVTLPVATLVG
jgi:hypothetical protein